MNLDETLMEPEQYEEYLVLAGYLADAQIRAALSGEVDPADFTYPIPGAIFRAAAHLQENGEPIETVSMSRALTEAHEFKHVGGLPKLFEVFEFRYVDLKTARHYARAIHKRAVARRLTGVLTSTVEQLKAPHIELDDILPNVR